MNLHASTENSGSHQLDVMTFEVWRGDRVGEFQTFEVPRRENQTVLDVVTEIQRNQDATLSYRFACRVGMCGSCAMIVNGRPRWTCRTRVDQIEAGTIRLEPLRNLPIVKDLAVDSVRPPMPASNASIAESAIRPAMWFPGTRTISARPRSIAPGPWSTMSATAARTSAFRLCPAMPAVTPVIAI